jgi:hypothetical protein
MVRFRFFNGFYLEWKIEDGGIIFRNSLVVPVLNVILADIIFLLFIHMKGLKV